MMSKKSYFMIRCSIRSCFSLICGLGFAGLLMIPKSPPTTQRLKLNRNNFEYKLQQKLVTPSLDFHYTPEPFVKPILLWTSFFQDSYWFNFFPNETGREVSTEDNKKCIYLTRDKLPVRDAAAVVFHPPDIDLSDSPMAHRKRSQYWVMFTLESPVSVETAINGLNVTALNFNWTMSYSRKSDVWYPYGKFKPSSFLKKASKIKNKIDGFVRNFAARKRDAVWIASNCVGSPSHRELLVKKLIILGLNVEILGGCGTPSLPFDLSIGKLNLSNYRYYFAFENALCDDYVTEKVYQAFDASLRFGLIPVIYNGARLDAFLPQGSYIDIFAYENVKSLATALKNLAENATKLSSYFSWQLDYTLLDYNHTFTSKHYISMFGWSALCTKLWSANVNKTESKIVNPMVHFGTCGHRMKPTYFNMQPHEYESQFGVDLFDLAVTIWQNNSDPYSKLISLPWTDDKNINHTIFHPLLKERFDKTLF